MNSNRFKIVLLERNVTIATVAEHAGMSVATMYAKLRGERDFKREEMLAVKDCLNLTADEFKEIFSL